jgi:hypothetical protein
MSHFNGTKSGPPKKQKKGSLFHLNIYLNCSMDFVSDLVKSCSKRKETKKE